MTIICRIILLFIYLYIVIFYIMHIFTETSMLILFYVIGVLKNICFEGNNYVY